MSGDYENMVRSLSLEKALAVALYGESVASYRYRSLAEKCSSPAHQRIFTEMADEEQGHHSCLQELTKKHFPGSDFVLTPHDKALVIVGPRMLDITDRASFQRAMQLIQDSERLTGQFYAALRSAVVTSLKDLEPVFAEMADECFDHAERLSDIPPLA